MSRCLDDKRNDARQLLLNTVDPPYGNRCQPESHLKGHQRRAPRRIDGNHPVAE